MDLQIIPVNFKGVQQSGNGSVNVVVPPLHFQVVTATLNVKSNGARHRGRPEPPGEHPQSARPAI
jgi:hypothetical protein